MLVDAPCSGAGTWRRNPDAKWRLRPDDLTELQALQRRILESACRLVRPGGRLVYVTCSLLPAENGGQVDWFLAQRPDFALRPVAEIWAEAIGGACPADGPGDDTTGNRTLALTPARNGTDGFFVAVLERRPAGEGPS